MPSIGKQVWVGIMTAFALAAISIVEMVVLTALGLEPTAAIIVMGAINGLLFSVLHQWWSVGLPTPPEPTRQGHESLRLIAGDQATIAELHSRYYTGPDAPDWSDQFDMLRHVPQHSVRISMLRQDHRGEYWVFDLYRANLDDDKPRDACRRMFHQDFRHVNGDEQLYRGSLLVVRD